MADRRKNRYNRKAKKRMSNKYIKPSTSTISTDDDRFMTELAKAKKEKMSEMALNVILRDDSQF